MEPFVEPFVETFVEPFAEPFVELFRSKRRNFLGAFAVPLKNLSWRSRGALVEPTLSFGGGSSWSKRGATLDRVFMEDSRSHAWAVR